MVDARDQRRATAVLFDEFKAPERVGVVQRLHGQFGHTLLERLLFALALASMQLVSGHMALELKVGVVCPMRASGVFAGDLHKTPVGQQPLAHALAEGGFTDAGAQNPHAHDHHEVGRGVHAQPGRVDLAHALAFQSERGGECLLDQGQGARAGWARCGLAHGNAAAGGNALNHECSSGA